MTTVDESVLNDTPETAPALPRTHAAISAAEIRDLRNGTVFKTLRRDFRAAGARHRNPDGSTGAPCWLCFGPDTLIRTSRGYDRIADIRPGDYVLSGDGSYQPVLDTYVREFEGTCYQFRSSTMTSSALVTPEHPILAMHSGHLHRNKFFRRDGQPICSPGCCVYSRSNGKDHEQRIRGRHWLDFTAAKNLTTDSWVATAYPTNELDLNSIPIGGRTTPLTDDVLWCMGLYAAEGSCSARHITYTLHEDEREYQDRVLSTFRSLGFTASLLPVSPGTKAMRINISRTALAQQFENLFGRGCHNKRLPEFIMRLPGKRAWHAAQGVLDGDGSQDRVLIQTSRVLALQVQEIAARSGRKASCGPVAVSPGKKAAYSTTMLSSDKSVWSFLDRQLAGVRAIDPAEYSGPVHNLHVAGENTYVVENIAVHNCNSDIDYKLAYPHPYSWSLDHAITVKERPDLLLDPLNFRHSHHDCNQQRGTDDPKLDIGEPSEVW